MSLHEAAALAADGPYPGPRVQSIDDEGWTQRYYAPIGLAEWRSAIATPGSGRKMASDCTTMTPASTTRRSRFIQPDTIVPGASNTQTLNRYSYVLNNPMKYTDPTGHWTPEEDPSDTRYYTRQYGAVGVSNTRSKSASILRKLSLWHTAEALENVVKWHTYTITYGRDRVTDLPTAGEAMMAVLKKAARYADGDTRIYAEDTNAVLSGHDIDLWKYVWTRKVDNSRDVEPNYYATFEGSSGFAPMYQDPVWDNEQAHHFWFYVQLTYEQGESWGMRANVFHELADPDPRGRSWQDFALGVQGIEVGKMCRYGWGSPEAINRYIENYVMEGSLNYGY